MSFITIIGLALITSTVPTSSFAQSARTKKNPKVVSISGCVQRDETAPDQFTLTDPSAGGKFRLTGKDFREYLGRRVQLDGGIPGKGLKIAGGLQPNPNVAAQAGAIDPARAAVQAATTASTTGNPVDVVQEFRVKNIHSTGGSCQ